MCEENYNLKKGQRIIIERGYYSDKENIAIGIIAEDFDISEKFKEFYGILKTGESPYRFIQWIENKKLIIFDGNFTEINISDMIDEVK